MSENNTGGPAFPRSGATIDKRSYEEIRGQQDGMTLRDYFAAKAMQARLSDYESLQSLAVSAKARNILFADEVAVQSYDMADAMLKAREA